MLRDNAWGDGACLDNGFEMNRRRKPAQTTVTPWLLTLLALWFAACEHGPGASPHFRKRAEPVVDDAGALTEGDAGVLADLDGRLVDETQTPVPNTKLVVAGQTVTTDAEGRFTVRDVPELYDVWLAPGDNYGRNVVYSDLSTREPEVRFLGIAPTRRRTAVINATAPAADSDTVISAYIVETDGSWPDYIPDQGRGVQARLLGVEWADSEAASVKVHAFRMQVDPKTKQPVAYLGYALRDLTLHDGERVEWAVTWEPMPFDVIRREVDIGTAEGLTTQLAFLNVRFPDSRDFYFRLIGVETARVSLLLPKLPGAIFDFRLAASAAQKDSLVYADATDITSEETVKRVDVPFAIPTLSRLAPDATLSAGLELSWSNPLGLPARVTLAPRNAPADAPMFEFYVRGSEFTIPPELGEKLPADTQYAIEIGLSSSTPLDTIEGTQTNDGRAIFAYQQAGELRTKKR